MTPPFACKVLCNELTDEASALTVLFSAMTLPSTVVIVASFALLLTTDVRELNSVKPPFAEIAVESEFTAVVSAFVDNADTMELAKLGLLPKAAAISTSVFKLDGAPFNIMEIFPSKYEVVAFKANPADRVETLVFSALCVVCIDANDVAIAPDTDATDAVRVETSVFNARLSVVFVMSRNATDIDIALTSDMMPL